MRPIDGDALADVLTAISGIKVDTGRADKEWAVTLSAAKSIENRAVKKLLDRISEE